MIVGVLGMKQKNVAELGFDPSPALMALSGTCLLETRLRIQLQPD